MNLIANTGVQYVCVPLEINPDHTFKMYFHEWFDTEDFQLRLELAHHFEEDDIWVKKRDLSSLGYVMDGNVVIHENGKYVSVKWENIKKDFYSEGKTPIPLETDTPEKSGCFQLSVKTCKWEAFEDKWLPFPFFHINEGKSAFGPVNWCRFKFIPESTVGNIKKYSLLLAFDTRTAYERYDFEDEDLMETPVFTDIAETSKEYAACNNEFSLVDFCSGLRDEHGQTVCDCKWVDAYILQLFHHVKNINDRPIEKPKLMYLAYYIYIIRYIRKLDVLPKITLYSNKNVAYGNVDLVVDIGNSRTCAVLFDNGDFTKVSPLVLQDLSNPLLKGSFEKMEFFTVNSSVVPTDIVENGKIKSGKIADYQRIKLNKYEDSFDMRLAFREADFGGNFGIINSRQFVYPSMIRLGKEAAHLIHQATNMNTEAEKRSASSSPKRYLWDNRPQKREWEFIRLEDETAKLIYIEGISEQLNTDGSLNTDGMGGTSMCWSRRALMTFAFLEILAQANMQINSYEQRYHWGSESTPRQVGRIIITCPTAMSKVEQIALRKCAEDAAIMLGRFFENTCRMEIDERKARAKVQVIPSVKNLSNKEERTEWIYDEATCAQFAFLYAETGKRYRTKVKDYFDLYGKVRNDLGAYNKKSLTVGSVDIGAGTTDVMIAAYKQDDTGQCTLTPVPLFWESFYHAGDDLLKRLVHQLVVEGSYSPVEKKLKLLGQTSEQISKLNNDFFGGDNGMSIPNRRLRSDFNLQISVPVVLRYLELLRQNAEDEILAFNDIFGNHPPTQHVLNRFREHFGFDFDTLQWPYEKQTVSAIVEKTFDTLIGKISSLFSYYACDIVLLSGRPTSLKPLTDLFLKYYAISPHRLKTMNNYRVGRWYPEDKRYRFLDGNGYFINPKSIVTTGAMIGYCASAKGGLEGFSLNLKELVEKLTPTTEYFGKLKNDETLEFIETNISPQCNLATIEISSLPVRIGCRQLDAPSYPSRPFYTLDFNMERIEDRIEKKIEDRIAEGSVDRDNQRNAVQEEVKETLAIMRGNMPLKVVVARNYSEDKERLSMESIVDKNGNDLPTRFFHLQVQSMSESEDFWLDSGIFLLNIN